MHPSWLVRVQPATIVQNDCRPGWGSVATFPPKHNTLAVGRGLVRQGQSLWVHE